MERVVWFPRGKNEQKRDHLTSDPLMHNPNKRNHRINSETPEKIPNKPWFQKQFFNVFKVKECQPKLKRETKLSLAPIQLNWAERISVLRVIITEAIVQQRLARHRSTNSDARFFLLNEKMAHNNCEASTRRSTQLPHFIRHPNIYWKNISLAYIVYFLKNAENPYPGVYYSHGLPN